MSKPCDDWRTQTERLKNRHRTLQAISFAHGNCALDWHRSGRIGLSRAECARVVVQQRIDAAQDDDLPKARVAFSIGLTDDELREFVDNGELPEGFGG
jgi:hypothetical protein